MNENFQDEIEKNIYNDLDESLRDFIRRVSLVRELIFDLGLKPEELRRLGPAAWIQKNIPQSGIWRKDTQWQYFLHGKGCRLTNITTGEILDWNSADESGNNIDPYAFIRYLEWRIHKDSNFENIKQYAIKKDLRTLLPLIHQILSSIVRDQSNGSATA